MRLIPTTDMAKGMPIGIPDDHWKDYLFRLMHEVGSFQIVTLGAKEGDPVDFQTEIFWAAGDRRETIPLKIGYPTHGDAEQGHHSLVQLAQLAESPQEFLTLFDMSKHNVLLPDMKIL